MSAHPQLPHVLRIGRRERINVADLADASHAYQDARDESGEGASTFPEGRIDIGGKAYRISYNGRVWAGTSYVAGEPCIMEAQ